MTRMPAMCMIVLAGAAIAIADAARPLASASLPATSYPAWDGRETQAQYARRAGIKDAQLALQLDANVTMPLVLIPAGTIKSGDPNIARNVAVTAAFYMSATEVTQSQYEAIMAANPSRVIKAGDHPVDDVTWNEATEFCQKLSQKVGHKVSLPTEAQWEHGYRAGTTTAYFFGDDEKVLGEYAWFGRNGDGKTTHAVGGKKPNPWGLYDMAGNINEWCNDFFDLSYYTQGDKIDPAGPKTGKTHVIKGGSVMQISWLRPEFRRGVAPDYRFGQEASPMIIGFRVVMAIDGSLMGKHED